MTQDDRIDKLEARVDRIEAAFDQKLDAIYEKVNALTVASVKQACPSPGACVQLGRDLETSMKFLTACTERVERLELKLIEVDRYAITEFHKLEKTKAWLIGVWSGIAFVSSIIGAGLAILVNYILSKL